MHEQSFSSITIRSSRSTSYYSEQEAIEYCQLETELIHQLYDAGVVVGVTVAGEERRYSDDDITLLRRARRLHRDLGINIEGVEIILRLSARLEALQHELEQYRQGK